MGRAIGYVKQAAVPLMVVGMVVVMAYLATGCGSTLQMRPVDPMVRNAIIEEAGFAAFYYGLRKGTDERFRQGEDAIRGCRLLMDTLSPSPESIIARLSARIQQITEPDEETGVLVVRAMNLLNRLVEVELTVPEHYRAAMDGLDAFLRGAEGGIEALRQARTSFDLRGFENDLAVVLERSRAEFVRQHEIQLSPTW